MNIQRKKLNIGKARRRVQIRSALLLTLGAYIVVAFGRGFFYLPAFAAIPRGIVLAIEAALSLLGFGGAAYLGLFVLDGDHRQLVSLRRLSRAQMLWLSLLGVLCVCPMALISDLMGELWSGMWTQAIQTAAAGTGLFTAQLLRSVLIVPVVEEAFFRGYLFGSMRRYGKVQAALLVSLCFAWVHGSNFTAYALFSLLLCLMTDRADSLLAPVFVHACYNLTLIVLDNAGLSGLFMGWSLAACMIRLIGCAAFAAVLKKAYLARGVHGAFALWEGGRLKRRELVLVIAAAVMLIVSMIMGG